LIKIFTSPDQIQAMARTKQTKRSIPGKSPYVRMTWPERPKKAAAKAKEAAKFVPKPTAEVKVVQDALHFAHAEALVSAEEAVMKCLDDEAQRLRDRHLAEDTALQAKRDRMTAALKEVLHNAVLEAAHA